MFCGVWEMPPSGELKVSRRLEGTFRLHVERANGNGSPAPVHFPHILAGQFCLPATLTLVSCSAIFSRETSVAFEHATIFLMLRNRISVRFFF
jgi:hypothetical protein